MKIAIIGSSGHGGVVAEAIEDQRVHQIAGWIDSFRAVGEQVGNYEVLGHEKDVHALLEQGVIEAVVVALGDNWQRAQMVERLRQQVRHIRFVSVIHPNAQVSRSATVGEGSVILSGAVITANSRIGGFCIVNTQSSLDHDCVMEDYSSLAPNSATGGRVHIGAYSAVLIGANIVHRVTVDRHCLIGAGATLLKDVEAYSVCYGTPARIIRKRTPDEPYL